MEITLISTRSRAAAGKSVIVLGAVETPVDKALDAVGKWGIEYNTIRPHSAPKTCLSIRIDG